MIAYHASNKKFNKFSLEQANTGNHIENFKALWFSTDRDYIKQFGEIIYKVNIDTKNFLRENQYNKIDKLVHEFNSTCDDGIGILETERGQEFADFLVNKGYDGYIFPQNDGKTIICFNPDVISIKEIEDSPFDKMYEEVTDLNTFKYKRNVNDFTSELLEMGKIANPSNPYAWVADKMEDMSKWNKKDWEFLFKKELSFNDIRGAQTTFEKIAKEIRKIADSYEESKRFSESLTVYNGGATKEESDGLKYYALDKRYVKFIHPHAKINQYEIEPQNIFDYSNPKHVEMLLDKLPEKIVIKDNYRRHEKTYSKEHFKRVLEGDKYTFGNWDLLEDKTIQKIIKDLGFDSMYLLEYSFSGKEWKNIAMFESMNEKLEELSDGIYATQSAYDILNLFKNKPKAYRVVYDKNNRYYFIGDALKYIHSDLISAAYNQGFYYDEFDMGSRDEIVTYLGNNLETQDILMLSFFPKDFGDIKAIDDERSSDWYTNKYTYDFGTIYVHEMNEFEDFDFYHIAKPLSYEKLELPESLDENLEKLENDYGEDIYATKYEYEVVNYCKETKSCLKILYANGWYFIGSAYSLIHNDLKNTAAKNGFFGEVEFKYGNAVVNTEDHDLFTFDVNTDEENARLEDEDKFVYEYPFGLFYTKRHIEDTPLYKYLGKPLNIRTLKSIYESLNSEIERYL